MTSEEIAELQSLVNRSRPPRNGMEIHFLRVLGGAGRAASPKEAEWLHWAQANENDAPKSEKRERYDPVATSCIEKPDEPPFPPARVTGHGDPLTSSGVAQTETAQEEPELEQEQHDHEKQKAIEELHTALTNNANEHQLLDLIDRNLNSLKSKYRRHANEMEFLKLLSPLQEALREFIDAVEDKGSIRTREDAQDLASRFAELRDKLSPHLVSKRADKEMREVIAKSKTLPFGAVVAGDVEFQKRRIRLESAAKPCQKCGAKMVLRESQYGYFWGCGDFPTCFASRWLSPEDSESLFP